MMSDFPCKPAWQLRLRNRVRCDAGNSLHVAKNSRIRRCRIHIKGQGNRLVIAPDANLRCVHLEIIGHHCEIHIESGNVIGGGCYLSCRETGTSLSIGRDGMLSRNVKLMTGDGHDICRDGVKINPARSISLGARVWLADSVIVLKGVTIGDDAVVGIGAIVTRDLPDQCVAVGNPARVVQTGITWVR